MFVGGNRIKQNIERTNNLTDEEWMSLIWFVINDIITRVFDFNVTMGFLYYDEPIEFDSIFWQVKNNVSMKNQIFGAVIRLIWLIIIDWWKNFVSPCKI